MPIVLDRIKGICFDIDGTLSDTDDEWVSRLESRLKPFSFLLKEHDARRTARRIVMALGGPMNFFSYVLDRWSLDDNVARLLNRLAKRSKRGNKPFFLMSNADNILNYLNSKYPLTVVSARDAGSALRFLNQFELNGFFKTVVTSQTCVHTKPFADPIIFAAKELELDPRECVMIGDTTVDILAAKAAGAQSIGLLCGFGTEKELIKAGADLVLKDLYELESVFNSKLG
jgi:N-acetyl-D-muramate 6-phosphate phosphatase